MDVEERAGEQARLAVHAVDGGVLTVAGEEDKNNDKFCSRTVMAEISSLI